MTNPIRSYIKTKKLYHEFLEWLERVSIKNIYIYNPSDPVMSCDKTCDIQSKAQMLSKWTFVLEIILVKFISEGQQIPIVIKGNCFEMYYQEVSAKNEMTR